MYTHMYIVTCMCMYSINRLSVYTRLVIRANLFTVHTAYIDLLQYCMCIKMNFLIDLTKKMYTVLLILL